ncbi:MAG: hypothetical protein AAGC55_33985, partial [Myxococcota bacterium]
MSGICAGRRGKVALGDVIFANRLWSYDAGKQTDRFQGDPLQYRPQRGWVQRMQSLVGYQPPGDWHSDRRASSAAATPSAKHCESTSYCPKPPLCAHSSIRPSLTSPRSSADFT